MSMCWRWKWGGGVDDGGGHGAVPTPERGSAAEGVVVCVCGVPRRRGRSS